MFLTFRSTNLKSSKIRIPVSPSILVSQDFNVWVTSGTRLVRLQFSFWWTVFQFVWFRFFVALGACLLGFWCTSAHVSGWTFCTLKVVPPVSTLIAVSMVLVAEGQKTLSVSTHQEFRVWMVGCQQITCSASVHHEPAWRHRNPFPRPYLAVSAASLLAVGMNFSLLD